MDEDFDLEPHTPATLDAVGHQDTAPPVGTHGVFPPPSVVDSTAPVSAQTKPGAASPAAPRRNNPYATSPRVSPSIPVGATPPELSPQQRTPVGSHDGRASLPPVGSKGNVPMPPVGGIVIPTGPSPQRLPYPTNATPNSGSAPRAVVAGFGPGSAPRPRLSGASVDDGGRMGEVMGQAPPRPSWMGGGPGGAAAGSSAPSSASQPIPVSPIAEAMLRPQSGSLPRGSAPGTSVGSVPRGSAPGSSAPRFSSSKR